MRILVRALALGIVALIFSGFMKLDQNRSVDQGARIKLDNIQFHFGEVEEGTLAEHVFKLTNVGDEPLRILKVEGT